MKTSLSKVWHKITRAITAAKASWKLPLHPPPKGLEKIVHEYCKTWGIRCVHNWKWNSKQHRRCARCGIVVDNIVFEECGDIICSPAL